MEQINYTLPEFCFLDGLCHLGDLLEGRTVIQHVRTYSVIEIIHTSELIVYDFANPTYEFTYNNGFFEEKIMFALHFSLTYETGLPINDALMEVFKKCEDFYKAYLIWEEKNIDHEREGNNN